MTEPKPTYITNPATTGRDLIKIIVQALDELEPPADDIQANEIDRDEFQIKFSMMTWSGDRLKAVAEAMLERDAVIAEWATNWDNDDMIVSLLIWTRLSIVRPGAQVIPNWDPIFQIDLDGVELKNGESLTITDGITYN